VYLYRHIRLDKNEPFYIGIGTSKYYNRARSKKDRNNIWKKIVNKTDYEIEILFDNLTLEKAKEKEIEFIKLYGRINKKTGVLANLTDGGDGCSGLNQSNVRKVVQKNIYNNVIKIYSSIASVKDDGFSPSCVISCCKKKMKLHKGFIWQYFNQQTDDLSFNLSKDRKHKKSVIQKDKDGNIIKIWESVTQAIESGNKFTSIGITNCCNRIMRYHYGFQWEFVDKKHLTRYTDKQFRVYKKVVQINPQNNLAVKIWDNADRAAETLGFDPAGITNCCKGVKKERYNYKWEYFNKNKQYNFDSTHKIINNKERKERKKIAQIDKNTGEIVKIYKSIAEAVKIGKFNWKCINNCLCKKYQEYRGFRWEYLYKF
jgi:hypothetical protein